MEVRERIRVAERSGETERDTLGERDGRLFRLRGDEVNHFLCLTLLWHPGVVPPHTHTQRADTL